MKGLVVSLLIAVGVFDAPPPPPPPPSIVTEAQWEFYDAVEQEMKKQTRDTEVVDALRAMGVDSAKAERLAIPFKLYGEQTNTDPKLLIAIAAVESQFVTNARNPSGATGLMQVVPSRSWRKYEDDCGARLNRQNLLEPDTNICFGAYIYRWFRNHHGDRRTALHAYNNGTGRENGYADRVLRHLRRME